MKALSYLQKVGAVPDYDSWDVLMAVVVIITDFYSPDMLIEPDIVDWVQQASDQGDFEERCNGIFYGSSGDVRALFPHICDKPAPFLKGLLEALIDTKLRIHCAINAPEQDVEGDWFATTYNNMVGLKGKRRFPTKMSILHTYCSGALTDSGQEILSNLVGTEADFVKEVKKLQSDFALFVSEGELARTGFMEIEDEKPNPFEGGFQAKIDLIVPGVDDPQECTLHWAPWPTAKTKSFNTTVRAICQSFSDKNRELWISSKAG